MALYGYRNLFHSKELSPLLSRCRNLSRGFISSVYWSLRSLPYLGLTRSGLRRLGIAICSGQCHSCLALVLRRVGSPDGESL